MAPLRWEIGQEEALVNLKTSQDDRNIPYLVKSVLYKDACIFHDALISITQYLLFKLCVNFISAEKVSNKYLMLNLNENFEI